jgi:hypothetical protein
LLAVAAVETLDLAVAALGVTELAQEHQEAEQVPNLRLA